MSEEDRAAVRAQLDRLLNHRVFKASPRSSKLLGYLVGHALAEGGEPVKERVLGVEVFARDGGYDTNLDPIVRNVAADLRKRIAQYYHEPEHAGEMRIDLPAGSYAPLFRPPAVGPADGFSPLASRRRLGMRNSPARLAIIFLLAVAAAGGLAWRHWNRNSLRERFWSGLLDSRDPVMLFVNGLPSANYCGQSTPRASADMVAVASHIIRYLDGKQKNFDLRPAKDAGLAEMRSGPAALVGIFDDPRIEAKLAPLRYHFATDCARSVWIEDATHPSAKNWAVDLAALGSGQRKEYGIVARIADEATQRPLIVVAGTGESGAFTAAEFLTDAAEMEKLKPLAPKGWEAENAEIVLSTQVIDGKAGPPAIEAANFWRR